MGRFHLLRHSFVGLAAALPDQFAVPDEPVPVDVATWGGIIAPPGFMKSPVMAAMVRPLLEIQADWRQQYEEDLAEFEREKEEYELRRAAWRDQFKAAAKKGRGAPERPDDARGEPTPRRLIINDARFGTTTQLESCALG